MSAPQPPEEPIYVHPYPSGEKAPGYRWAFTAWVILFLLVICLGLVNYLATMLKHKW